MSNDGTTFEIDLPVVGQAGIDAATRSMDMLQDRLDAATKAVKAQSDSYKQAEQIADKAAKAYERLAIAADTKGGDWVARAAEAKKQADLAKAAIEGEALALDKLRASASKAETELKKFKDAQAEAKEKAGKLESGLRSLGGGAAADTIDKVTTLKTGIADLSKVMGPVGVLATAVSIGVFLVAAAAVAAAVSITALTLKIAEWAISMADAQRSAILLASGGFVQSTKAGKELYDTVGALTKRFPLTREELTATAKSLAYYGLKGKDLTTALERSATWAARMKFGPDFEKQMLALPEQSKVFQQNLLGVFGGLKIDPLLKALQLMVSLFDESTASGNAIKVVFESIFQPMIDKVADSKYKIERFFILLEIWAIEALTALKPYYSTIYKLGETLLVVAGIVTGVLVSAFLLGALAVASLILQMRQLFDFGKDIVTGLANGIKAAGGAVVDAITGVVMDAVNAAKKLLHIASPSKVFAEIGMQTGAGMEQGVERSSAGVQDAMANMVSPPTAAGEPKAAPDAGSTSASKSGANISGNTFVFHGVQGAEDAESKFGALLTRLLEGDATQLGASVPT